MGNLAKAYADKNWGELKKFFEENNHLSVCEIALNLNKSPSTIRNWRRHSGYQLKKYPFKNRPVAMPIAVEVITDRSIWDNEEWFREQYEQKHHGLQLISKIIGRNQRVVTIRLKRYGIKTRDQATASRSHNPCASAEWLIYHYGTKEEYLEHTTKSSTQPDPDGGRGWSIRKCAIAAGVVPATLYFWLTRANRDGVKINIRDPNEAQVGIRNPFYGKKHTPENLEKMKESLRRGYLVARTKTSDQDAGEKQPGQGSLL